MLTVRIIALFQWNTYEREPVVSHVCTGHCVLCVCVFFLGVFYSTCFGIGAYSPSSRASLQTAIFVLIYLLMIVNNNDAVVTSR